MKKVNEPNRLWPYSRALALATIPIIFLLSGIVLAITHHFVSWPGKEIHHWVILLVAIISIIPLLLVLLDFFASSRAVLDVRGVKIDFSKIDLANAGIKRAPTGIPDNIGVKGQIISDSSPMDIIEALKETVQNELIIINLGRGDSWWVTRLLVLAAGAVRVGSPEAFVFIGDQENMPDRFLGWAKQKDVLQAILQDNEQYKVRYKKSIHIAQQFNLFNDPDLLPIGLNLPQEVARYANDDRYSQAPENVNEQILMDQLVLGYGYGNTGSLEETPDRLTSGRLQDLFGHCLYRQSIDLNTPNEVQIQTLIVSKAPYLALVRQGIFDSMLKLEDGERLILKTLLEQSKEENKGSG